MFCLQKLYIVCDVALFVMANKSTACHLDSPKDPVLPSKFFLVQDKASVPCFHTVTTKAYVFEIKVTNVCSQNVCVSCNVTHFTFDFSL